ncbi:translocase of chloroplast 120, chloroplastic-like protein [Tanacetum coccineum]
MDHRNTRPDGEISGEVNGDQLHEDVNGKDALVTDDNDDDSVKQNDEVESTTNDLLNAQNEKKVEQNEEVVPKRFKPSSSAIHEPEVERQPSFDDKVSESVADSSEIREQKDEDKPLNKEPESIPVIGVSLSRANLSIHPHRVLRPCAPLLEPAHRVAQSQANGNVSPPHNQVIDEPTNGEAEENDETREKLQMIRVKFLRLARRLGQTPHNVVVAQVLYRLGLAEQLRGRTGGRVAAFSFERASAMAEQLEAAGQEPLEFSCTIMVLGKTGVGKSATINSIFDEVKFGTDAFQLGTKKVQDVVGTVQGIKVRVIDTPGLLPSWADQRKNQKILQSVKKFIQKSPPDIVLYLDRLDMQSRDDMPLLRTITDIFGQSIWFNAIVVLTHAASAPPEGPNGTATSYDMFVTQRSHVVQQAIRQAAGDMRLMNPVSLVENHSACRTNRNGQRVLPNAARLATWKAVCSQKSNTTFTLHSVNSFGDDNDDALDDDIDESSDEETSEYDELEYREKLFMKKQLKEEKKRRKMMKKMAEAAKIFPTELTDNNVEEDNNHTHRYRVLDSANQWLIRPVLDPHGWDHDVGYEGINVEHLLALKEKITVSFSGQVVICLDLKLRLSGSNSLMVFSSRDFLHRQLIFKEAESKSEALKMYITNVGESLMLRSILADQSQFLSPEVFLGEDAAIKVQRPEIEPIIYRDFFLFQTLPSFLNGISLQKLCCNAEHILHEFGEKLLEDLDYTLEPITNYCHPKMALVIGDRLKVWDESEQPRVHAVSAFAPDFDDSLLQRVNEVAHEDDINDILPPDMSNYSIYQRSVFSSFGPILKIAMFDKNGDVQALIQYPIASFDFKKVKLVTNVTSFHGWSLVVQLFLAVGVIAFATWGLGALLRAYRILFKQKNDNTWTKSKEHQVMTSYIQPLLLWGVVVLSDLIIPTPPYKNNNTP